MRLHAQQVEKAAADEQAIRRANLAARVEVETRVAVGAGADQHVLMVPQVFPLRVGDRRVRSTRALVAENHELLRRMDRQLLEHQRVDQREDRHVGADAERQREQGDAADDRRLPHLPDGEREVAAERRHKSHAPLDEVHAQQVGLVGVATLMGRQARDVTDGA